MATNDSGFTGAGLRRLREVLERHVESGKIPGLVALVGRGDHTHVEAIGTMRHDGGPPMRRDTIFRMASTSKPVTMAAAMVLLDECRLRLDDPVDPWLPELADRQVLRQPDGPLDDTVAARRPITVRDLLTSTFGLGTDFESMTSPIRAATFERLDYSVASGPAPHQDEWMRRLGELPLQYQPGVRWQYDLSNEVTGVLVSRVTGQPLETFLRERILDPLGMNDTGFHVPADRIDRLPPLYGPDPQTGAFTVWDEAAGGMFSTPPVFQGAGGGLASTADDYHAYFRMLLNHGMHNGTRILSRAAVELMTTNRLTPAQMTARTAMFDSVAHLSSGQGTAAGWGFGMSVNTSRDDYTPVGRYGWFGGTGTTAYADPTHQLTGILLTQTGLSTPDSPRAMTDFFTTLHQTLN
ncbi:serine hydrolase [Streptomyces sp. UH6]|uniref:serine hydrolase domain-containing protein n=1 Tax=Streptomyces sp. UH6 TaxID=2748379 RepID=UPI0015D4C226|nr:serine hydrolase domain-containing protein [Streptomyces sp. UH6]NYV72902.1 beta-lactamase family protein [Streptomyces sp. UH6]